MSRFLFCNKGGRKWGYSVEADGLDEARKQLFIYCRLHDPFGHILELKHMTMNFELVTLAAVVVDVTKDIKEHEVHESSADRPTDIL